MSSSPISDDLITQFLSVTGTDDTSRATSYLEMSGGNLETAVGLYMEHSNAPSTIPSMAATAPGLSSDMSPPTNMPYQQPTTGLDGIRPPDEVQTMRLMDFDDGGVVLPGHHHAVPHHPAAANLLFPLSNGLGGGGGGAAAARHNPFYDARELVNAAAAAAAHDNAAAANDDSDEDISSITEMKEEDAPGPGTTVVKTLNNMFAPPLHLMHRAGGFQGARNVAKDARRWLLVNLQRDEDFACHALNRDVWRDELVENLVREGFIFWQAMDNTPDGMTYVQRYNVQAFPHVAILDPRTGRLMWKKEGWTQVNPMTSEHFAQIAADFCSHHTFDKPPTAPRSQSSSTAAATSSATSLRPPKRPIHELSEEQQLQAAIRASMAEQSDDDDTAGDLERTESDVDNNDYDNEDLAAVDSVAETSAALTTTEENVPMDDDKPKSFEEEIREMDVGEEPVAGGVARVQIRMPDGGRVVRKFREEDLVKVIYAFVAQSNGDGESGKSFELRAGYPPKDLISNANDTIKSCSLSGESISVRWK